MTDLFQRFSEDMDLAGYSPRSIDMYVRPVRQLTKHYQKSPEKSLMKNSASISSIKKMFADGPEPLLPLFSVVSNSSIHSP